MTDSATDNRTTELREKLDALGIVHFDYDKGDRTQTLWKSPDDTCYFTYETVANPDKTARLVIEWFPTPDQAIVATIGSDREKALEELVRDMWREITTCPDYPMPPCMTRNICDRIREFGIEVDDDER